MKRNLLTVICLFILITGVLAQNRPNVDNVDKLKKELSECQSESKNIKVAYKAAKDSIQRLNIDLNETKTALAKEKRFAKMKESENTELANLLERQPKLTNENCQEIKKELETVKKEKQKVEEDFQKVKKELNDTKNSLTNVESKQITYTKAQRVFPFFVTDIKLQSVKKKEGWNRNEYNNRLPKTEWLTVQIHCTGLIDEPKDITMRIKIYMPNGLVWKYYDYDYSTKDIKTTIYPGPVNMITINEWNEEKNNIFPDDKLKEKGTYRIEIWHEDVCLGSTTFEIIY